MKEMCTSTALIVALGAVLLGFMGVCNRQLLSLGLHPIDVSFVRCFLTALVLLLILLIRSPEKIRFRLRDWWVFALFGVMKFLSDCTIFTAQDTIPLSLATLLQMTAPYYVLFLSLLLFKERVTFRKIICMLLAFFGLMFVCDVFNGNGNIETQGVMCAVASGFFYGVYSIGGRVVTDHGYSPETTVLYVFAFACLCSVPLADFGAIGRAFTDPEAIVYCLLLGILMTLVPFLIYTWAATRIPVSTVSILGVIEAVAAAAAGFVFFDEALSPLNLAGMAVVLGSIVVLNSHICRKIEERGSREDKVQP